MTVTTTSTTFDTAAFASAIERRDAAAVLAMYAPDAEIRGVDETARPSHPNVLHGRDEIRAMLEDLCSRDMTHEVSAFTSGDRLAYQVRCRYPDGTRVLCHSIADLRDGRIAREDAVQVWDT